MAVFAVAEMDSHLVKRTFERPQRFSFAGAGAAGLFDGFQALGDRGLISLQLGHGGLEAGRGLGLFLGRGVEAFREALEGGQHLLQVVAAAGPARGAVLAGGTLLTGRRGPARGRAGGRVGVVVVDHVIQPLAEGHAGPARQVLGDLAGLRVDALNGPGRP